MIQLFKNLCACNKILRLERPLDDLSKIKKKVFLLKISNFEVGRFLT